MLTSLAICTTSSFANNISTPNKQKGGVMSASEDDFKLQYKNSSNEELYYDNDQGVKGAIVDTYQGHGIMNPGDMKNFSTELSTSLTSKGSKRQVYLYIPIKSGSETGKYKKLSFMIWSPYLGNPSWKLGTCNPGHPMKEDDYCSYSYHYDHAYAKSGSIISERKSWGLIKIQFEKVIGTTYLKIDTMGQDDPNGKLENSQTIDTNSVPGQIVMNLTNRPDGSYLKNCEDDDYKKVHAWNGHVLSLQCKDSSGSYSFTELNYAKECAHDSTVSNQDGKLVCDKIRSDKVVSSYSRVKLLKI